MQVRPETKWKRDQQGKWTRVEVQAQPGKLPSSNTPNSTLIPGVTFRVRTGKVITAIAARPTHAAVASGASVWVYRGPDTRPVQLASPSKVNGLFLGQSSVLASLSDGHVTEFDASTGRVRAASPDLGGMPVGAPVAILDGWLANLETGAVVALSTKLVPKWRFIPPAGTFGFQPAMSVGRGVYVPGESTLYRLDVTSGLVNWSVELGDRGCVTPTVTAGLAISAATGGGITCLDAATGKRRWHVGLDVTGSATWTGITSAGMHVVAASQQGDVVCVSRETSRIEWVRTGIGRVMFPPIGDVKHGCAVVFVQDTDAGIPAEVLGLDLRSGRTLWRARVGNLDAAPALTGDRLWIASATGTIYAFDYG